MELFQAILLEQSMIQVIEDVIVSLTAIRYKGEKRESVRVSGTSFRHHERVQIGSRCRRERKGLQGAKKYRLLADESEGGGKNAPAGRKSPNHHAYR